MRVTNSMQAIQIANTLQQGEDRLNTLSQQVSTGHRVTAPGDDPLATEQILALQGTLTANTQYSKNISMGTSWLSMQDSALTTANTEVTSALQLATMLSSETYSATDRANAANQIDQIKAQLISLGNTQVGNQYIFAGTKTDAPPYDSSGNYSGNSAPVSVQIDGSTSIAINNTGSSIFGNSANPSATPPVTGTGLLQTLDDLSAALKNNDTTNIRAAIGNLQTATTQIQAAQADIGAKENLLTSVSSMNDSLNTNLQQVITNYRDVDIVQATSNLAQQQTAFQAALQSTAMVEQLSLVNYL